MPSSLRYGETLDFLYSQLPMFTRVGAAAYKPDLSNTRALCEALGNPEERFRSVHVAGTNGKGSCSHMLAAIFQAAGYKTGLYTSPHIRDFRERIRIDGEMIPEEDVVAFTDRIKPMLHDLQPSFFEMTVAMAFDYFARKQVDIAIIETGLGGLLDSTNVIIPELSVITNISYDHMNLLGDTLPAIARQKAGIIKPGIPVVIGETQPELQPVFFATSVQQKSPLCYADEWYDVLEQKPEGRGQRLTLFHRTTQKKLSYQLDLLGIYQRRNLQTVLASVHVLRELGWNLPEDRVQKALAHTGSTTGFRGRFDQVAESPTVILDVSHNAAGLMEVLDQAGARNTEQLWFILAFAADKDVDAVLPLLPRHARYAATRADTPRAMGAEVLKEKLAQAGLEAEAFGNVTAALSAVMPRLGPKDLLLVTGTFFVLDEAYAFFGR